MKVAVIGSRTFNDYKLLVDKLSDHDISLIISGGARGADSLAERYAKEYGIETKIFPAEWGKYGNSAGPRRNIDIINECEMVVAFWDGTSSGTKHSIDTAKKSGKKVQIYKF